jgi:hypothetical protein
MANAINRMTLRLLLAKYYFNSRENYIYYTNHQVQN